MSKQTAKSTAQSQWIKRVFASGVIFFVVTFCAMVAAIAFGAWHVPREAHDAVVVLGAGLVGGDRVSQTLALRLDQCARYAAKDQAAVVVVSGGQGGDETVSEAFAMKNYLVEKGVAESRILMEDRSTSTKENFLYTKEILDSHFKAEPYDILYITNDFHIARAGLYAKKAGFQAEGLACDTPLYSRPMQYVREYCALAWYFVAEPFL